MLPTIYKLYICYQLVHRIFMAVTLSARPEELIIIAARKERLTPRDELGKILSIVVGLIKNWLRRCCKEPTTAEEWWGGLTEWPFLRRKKLNLPKPRSTCQLNKRGPGTIKCLIWIINELLISQNIIYSLGGIYEMKIGFRFLSENHKSGAIKCFTALRTRR